MKLEIDFSGLVLARESIGAKLSTLRQKTNLKPRTSNIELQLLEVGHVQLTADELSRELKFVGGIPSIRNQPVTLHIFQPHKEAYLLRQNPCYEGPKYHFFDCHTLETMRAGGRFNRYVASSRVEDGFLVQPYDPLTKKRGEEMNAPLLPCQNCLKSLDYDSFSALSRPEKKRIVESFSAGDMLESLKPIFRCLPLYTSGNMPEADYVAGWARISQKTRVAEKWTCNCCKVVLNDRRGRGLLHVHHKDGIRGNNRPSNLRVLCAQCHQSQPFHGHMKLGGADINYLGDRRREQGIPHNCVQCQRKNSP